MTQREIISLTYEFGLYINPRTSKSKIVKVINSINANPANFTSEWINLTKRYNEINLQDTRDKKLKKLGIV